MNRLFLKKIKMKSFISASVMLVTSHLLFGAGIEGEYAVSKIPPALLKNANMVVRYDHQRVELRSLTKLISNNRFVITILNEQADRYGYVAEWYDKFRSVEKFEGTLYDAAGKKIKSLKKSDIQDLSATSDISLAEDNRVKAHSFYYKGYPYTIEYELETVTDQTMFFPDWRPVPGMLCSIEQSSFTMVVPADYLLRYKGFNYPGEPAFNTVEGKKEYTWSLKNYEALRKEFASPSLTEITPNVLLAPTDFQIEGYKGNMKDWKELGKFQYTLNKGRNILPETVKQKVHDLTKGLKSDKEKIFALYEYLQKNTRYVSIQLGIGGWRPFDASYVSSKGYGDCKALSNFTHSLLLEAGIPSYFTLIKAGDDKDDIVTDFSSIQFNHAILCVPNKGDTVWLECTDQFKSPGYMGGFTGNRHALLITEEGGVLVETPRYSVTENLQERNITAKVDAEGTLQVTASTVFKGMQQDELHLIVNHLSKEKVKEYYLERGLDFGTYEIKEFAYQEIKNELPEMRESLSLLVNNYATVSGKRLFIAPNIMSRFSEKLKTAEERKYDIKIDYAYTDRDKVEIEIPSGYTTESMPQDIRLDTKFGKYASSVQLKENKIVYTRNLECYGGRFPKTDYSDLVKFYEGVYKADRNKLVLIKSGEEKKPF